MAKPKRGIAGMQVVTSVGVTKTGKGQPSVRLGFGEPKADEIMMHPLNVKDARLPFTLPPITTEICAEIGFIVTLWGAFEIRLDRLIDALLNLTGQTASDWEKRPFKKRKEQCASLAKAYFQDVPFGVAHVEATLAESAELHWKRNLLVHGRIDFTVENREDGSRSTWIVAHGRHNGKPIKQEFDISALERLSADIAHVSGRLSVILRAEVSMLGAPIDEIDRLRTLINKVLQAFLAPATGPNPPQSSGSPI